MKVKNNLGKILDEKGIKNRKIGELLNKSEQTISNIVNNRTKPNLKDALLIATFLDIPIEDIFYLEE